MGLQSSPYNKEPKIARWVDKLIAASIDPEFLPT